MSCGCGCARDCGAPSSMLMTGAYGLPSLKGLGLTGLGDICIDWDEYGNCISSMSTGGESQIPTESPYPVVMSTPGYTPAAAPSKSNLNFLDSLAGSWSAAAQQILKANSGALPTYQQVGPGGSTTMYGNAGNIPTSLQTSLLSATSGSGGILLIVAAVALFAMMGKK